MESKPLAMETKLPARDYTKPYKNEVSLQKPIAKSVNRLGYTKTDN